MGIVMDTVTVMAITDMGIVTVTVMEMEMIKNNQISMNLIYPEN